MKNYSKYFAVSEHDKSWGMHTLNCGVSSIEPGATFPSPEHPQSYQLTWKYGRILHEYQLIYLVDGQGVFESQHCEQSNLEAGSIILIHPEIWHRYKPVGNTTWHTYWVGFHGKLADDFIHKLDLSEQNPIKAVGYQESILQIYLDIIKTSQIEFTGYQQVFVGDVIKLIGVIHSIHRKSEFTQQNVDRLIQEAKLILMQKNLSISMEEVAEELNLSYSFFRKLFKDYTGISPGQYQMQHKINKAISLLNEGKSSIKEIAAELNFDTPQYFSRIFKKKTGKSPKEYSQQLMRRKGNS